MKEEEKDTKDYCTITTTTTTYLYYGMMKMIVFTCKSRA